MYLKRFHIGPYELGMFALVIAASLLRVILIHFHWPTTNSDEAVIDLMALHIAYHGEHPIFFYGQFYMGPLQAYIGALFFLFTHPSVAVVRLGLVLLFALFLIGTYALTCTLYTKKLALGTVALLSLGSIDLMLHELKALGGYPEIMLFGTFIFLITSKLALSSPAADQSLSPGERRRRFLIYGLLGLLTGVAIWSDMLIITCLLPAGLILLVFCRRDLRSWSLLSLLSGCIIGALPLIIYNIVDPAHNSLSVLLAIHSGNTGPLATQHTSFLGDILGTLVIALPTITGANPICSSAQPPHFGFPSSCAVFQGAWSIAYLILGTVAAISAGSFVLRAWRQRQQQTQTFIERQNTIRQFARLMLLLMVALTLLSYVSSSTSGLVPGPTSRYLICLLIAIPAILWPLWPESDASYAPGNSHTPTQAPGEAPTDDEPVRAKVGRVGKTLLISRVAILLLIFIAFIIGTLRVFADVPNAEAFYNQQDALIDKLVGIGATRIYSDYWTCNRLIFQSNEQIICSALSDNLKPGKDRYLPYHTQVNATRTPMYVFQVGSQATKAVERLAQQQHIHYQRYAFYGYVVYKVARRIHA